MVCGEVCEEESVLVARPVLCWTGRLHSETREAVTPKQSHTKAVAHPAQHSIIAYAARWSAFARQLAPPSPTLLEPGGVLA